MGYLGAFRLGVGFYSDDSRFVQVRPVTLCKLGN